MTEPKLKSAPLAYQNEPFLNSPDGRILRLLSEYQEPLTRFRREQIQDTVVFFGSARLQSPEDASAKLEAVHAGLSGTEAAQDMLKKQARAAVDRSRYYAEARGRAKMRTRAAAASRGR